MDMLISSCKTDKTNRFSTPLPKTRPLFTSPARARKSIANFFLQLEQFGFYPNPVPAKHLMPPSYGQDTRDALPLKRKGDDAALLIENIRPEHWRELFERERVTLMLVHV